MDANTLSISIKPLRTITEFRVCEDVQCAVWRLDDREVVPDHVLLTATRHGGLALGAFTAEGEMVGILFGFPGKGDTTWGADWMHCSHIVGVLPHWQGQGIGYRLKLAQREWVLRQGLKLIVWTYDPLESRNAALNIGKLGAVCRRYERDLYGNMRDVLNVGLLSDRFEVEWWIDSDRVRRRLDEGALQPDRTSDARPFNRVKWRADGLPMPEETDALWDGTPARLEIPGDFQRIRQTDLALAQVWRRHFRARCEAAFAAGYTVVDFANYVDADRRHSYYRLEAGSQMLETESEEPVFSIQ